VDERVARTIAIVCGGKKETKTGVVLLGGGGLTVVNSREHEIGAVGKYVERRPVSQMTR
jgi:hypothetical protein